MGDDNIVNLIKEIAAKHSIAIGKDDPILILHTMNQLLMEHNIKAQEALLDKFKEEIELSTNRVVFDISKKAIEAIDNSILESKAEADEIISEATQSLVKSLTELILNPTIKNVSDIKRWATLNLLASLLTLIAAAIVVYHKF